MSQSAGLVFTNDSGAGSGVNSYITDALPDFVFSPSVNTGFSSTVSNNPMGNNYANTGLPQYGAKYLPIKDLVLITDRSKWINEKTTYQVIFYENFPQIQAYVFGNVQLTNINGQVSVLVKTIGDGISVNGVVRQVAFILQPTSSTPATAQVVVDGSNEATTIDFSYYTQDLAAMPVNCFNTYLHNTTQESYNIHDIRLTANQANVLSINGIIAYFQNSSGSIDQFAGVSYVNKTKITNSSGTTLSIPSFGSSLGGNLLIYQGTINGITTSPLSCTTIASTASGSSGTPTINMAAGTGASLLAGYGMIITQGSSTYIGTIANVSTDTLTMGNTLGFGVTAGAPIYTAWQAPGPTLSINASLMTMVKSIDFSRLYTTAGGAGGFSQTIYDPQGLYALWGNNLNLSVIDGNQCANFQGGSGFLQVDGYFSAAEIETIGNATFNATISVNGFAAWNQSAGQTGAVKKTIFSNAGPGWNNFNIGAGTNMSTALGIQRINLYQVSRNYGISYGAIADYDIPQTYTNRDAINASLIALGGIRRTYADQIFFKYSWNRGQTWTVPGGVYYFATGISAALSFQYYGTNYGLCATLGLGSTLLLDGVGQTLTCFTMQSVATLGFHTISYTGGTASISAIDFLQPIVKSRVDAYINTAGIIPQAPTLLPPSVITFLGGNSGNNVVYTPGVSAGRRPNYIRVRMTSGGGGGYYAGSATSAPTSGATSSFGNIAFCTPGLIASGTVLAGGVGGTPSFALGNPNIVVLQSVSGTNGTGASANAIDNVVGGAGGGNPMGSGGGGGAGTSTSNAYFGGNGQGYGAGGGGGGTTGGSASAGGGGGGGAMVEFLIYAPASSYSVGVGAAGSGGVSSANGGNGGAGSQGIVIVEEYFQ